MLCGGAVCIPGRPSPGGELEPSIIMTRELLESCGGRGETWAEVGQRTVGLDWLIQFSPRRKLAQTVMSVITHERDSGANVDSLMSLKRKNV